MTIPKRIIVKISGVFKKVFSIYEQSLARAHRELFLQVVTPIIARCSCYVSDVARALKEL
jgi:hypothetical protein